MDKLNQARSRAFIRLYLKVGYGLDDFIERENFITDDPYDGYYKGRTINGDIKRYPFWAEEQELLGQLAAASKE